MVVTSLKFEIFPVDFPLSGTFLERIRAETATTAINKKGLPEGWPFFVFSGETDLDKNRDAGPPRSTKRDQRSVLDEEPKATKPRRGQNSP